MKVLLADDSPLVRRLLTQMVGRWGYEPVTCPDGAEAWKILSEKDAPALAILDWVMPQVSGVELCRRIRAEGREPYVYVILLTANESQEGVIEGLAASADDYLRKPFDEQELEVRLRAGKRILDLQAELVAARDTMRAQATHDSLTGLWNRGAILDLLSRELARAERDGAYLAVLLVDLDHFKRINDDHGHLIGDAALREAARRIQSAVRTYDSAGRYGGEEFLVLLPGCDHEAAPKRADEIRLAIGSLPVEAGGGGVIVLTASVGVMVRDPAVRATPEGLLKAADEALYRAKNAGRNRIEIA